jgi:toxin YoeB
MAKEIVWTRKSIEDRFRVFRFWARRNKSDVYSIKLESLFNESARVVAESPEIGLTTKFENIKVKII